mgnify:CR=1 FL=1
MQRQLSHRFLIRAYRRPGGVSRVPDSVITLDTPFWQCYAGIWPVSLHIYTGNMPGLD